MCNFPLSFQISKCGHCKIDKNQLKAIMMEDFRTRVCQMHANQDRLFRLEYEVRF